MSERTLALRLEEPYVVLDIEEMRLCLVDTPSNRKAMLVVARLLTDQTSGKPMFTFQELSESMGHPDRQWSHNFVREFGQRGEDMQAYLNRANSLKESAFEPIQQQILQHPLRPLAAQYELFAQTHPGLSLCYTTFVEYVRQVDSCQLIHRVQQLLTTGEACPDSQVYLEELLQTLDVSPGQRKDIVESFPEVESETPGQPVAWESATLQKLMLVALLYASGLSQQMLSLLFGVSRTSIHHWLYQFASFDLEQALIDAIGCWSGHINVDEKWIKINGVWHFCLHAVDALTGFPLLIRLHSSLDTTSWQVFFAQFKALYGTPKLLISDGSKSLLKAKQRVFPGVVHQLCKFHKLRNLCRVIATHVKDASLRRRCFRLARNVFANRHVSSRKHAARTLAHIGGKHVEAYVRGHILAPWRKLTRCLTNNAAERFNRKIHKAIKARYGIASPESAKVVLRSLWFKEVLLHGAMHLQQTHPLQHVNIARVCQESLNQDHILHFFSQSTLNDLDAAA